MIRRQRSYGDNAPTHSSVGPPNPTDSGDCGLLMPKSFRTSCPRQTTVIVTAIRPLPRICSTSQPPFSSFPDVTCHTVAWSCACLLLLLLLLHHPPSSSNSIHLPPSRARSPCVRPLAPGRRRRNAAAAALHIRLWSPAAQSIYLVLSAEVAAHAARSCVKRSPSLHPFLQHSFLQHSGLLAARHSQKWLPRPLKSSNRARWLSCSTAAMLALR